MKHEVEVYTCEKMEVIDSFTEHLGIDYSQIIPSKIEISISDNPIKPEIVKHECFNFKTNIFLCHIYYSKSAANFTLNQLQRLYPYAEIRNSVGGWEVSKKFTVVDKVVNDFLTHTINQNTKVFQELIDTRRKCDRLNDKIYLLKRRNIFQRIFKVGE